MAEFYGYKASIANSEDARETWKSPASMPKEAARLWLKVIDVRMDQLQEKEINPWVWIIEFERCEKPERV